MADQVQVYLAQFDRELSKYPIAIELEKKTNVPKTYLFGGILALLAVFVFFNIFGELITVLLGVLWCVLLSVKQLVTGLVDSNHFHFHLLYQPPTFTTTLVTRPAYQSFKAIDKHDKELTTKWLTYWVVYGFLDILEIFSDHLIYWVPFYYAFKALLVVYLIHPSFNGANVVYHKVLAPYLLKEEGVIDSNIAKIKTKVSQTFNDTVKQD
ncbi:hypothetical protein BCR33DRAFT_864431 [Rhizoclosmatium globosum]|uniref:Protein YOP1 n=1 Tax=Rhizoclosmatium globosum TaxID=329046 RepID=A0A1Y1ZQU4_9FUNG|nr:hypothetical protein BCR33DRAFT_864431 [Rhizoclosmatium globosum]|eukprot:ORY12165.1 hypothetical protein BCR33DRAFT_864431 [Rhizoclosmatium globosum]